jgi:hypothetical protein
VHNITLKHNIFRVVIDFAIDLSTCIIMAPQNVLVFYTSHIVKNPAQHIMVELATF